MKWFLLAGFCLVSVSAFAQRTDIRTPDGTLKGYIQQEGSRDVYRAPDGRMLGYSTQQGNTRTFRAPDGRLQYRETTH